MNTKSLVEKIRERLEARLSKLLDVAPATFAQLKTGTLAHLLISLENIECTGGFNTVLHGLTQLVGHEALWAEPVVPVAEKQECKKPN